MDPLTHKQLMLHGSWLLWPLIVWLIWRLRRAGNGRPVVAIALATMLVLAWVRFVEPQWIHVRHHTLAGTGAQARIALISDVHLGVYKDAAFLRRVVDRLNALSVDAVVIAGDLTYEPQGHQLATLFAPLGDLNAPAFAVLGNHDQQRPGPDVDAELRAALATLGVNVLEGKQLPPANGFAWAGLGDRWAGKDDGSFINAADGPVIVVAHNPDSAMDLRPDQTTLVLAGHTHGGQIRLPWIYPRIIPSQYGFDRDEQVAQTPHGPVRVFTSSGLGEVGLPLRLFNPPVIDVLTLQP